jgi:hypothetical protein
MTGDAALGEEGNGTRDEATWQVFQVEFALTAVDDLGHLQETVVSGRYADCDK